MSKGGFMSCQPPRQPGRGARPFSQLLVSSLSPIGMTAEAVAAVRRPALGRQWRDKPPSQAALRALA